MTTLLVAGRGRCTSACWEATTPECSCVCAGAFHGGGRERAMAQALLELPGEARQAIPSAFTEWIGHRLAALVLVEA